jgi:hypothetical protein
VPDLIRMALQNIAGFTKWHRPIKTALEEEEPLFRVIIKNSVAGGLRGGGSPCRKQQKGSRDA